MLFAGECMLLFDIVIKFPLQDIHTHRIAIDLISLLTRYFSNNVELLKLGKSAVDGTGEELSGCRNHKASG